MSIKAYKYAFYASFAVVCPYINLFFMVGHKPFILFGLPSFPFAFVYFWNDCRKSSIKERKEHIIFATYSFFGYLIFTYIIGLISNLSLTLIGFPGEKAETTIWIAMNFPLSIITHWHTWFGAV